MYSAVELAAAFGGGVLGAALGALPAFIMAGILVLANMPDMAFGPYFGPHIAFAGGVAATAFAAKRGLDAGNNILAPLVKINDGVTLLVGGLFGAAGLLVQKWLASMATPTDTVALTVALSGIVARVVFGNRKLLGGYSIPDGKTALLLISLGLGVGLISGYAAIVTKNVVLPFGVAATSLLFLQFMGVGPVTHHLALPAALAAAAAGNVWTGGLFGILGALIGDFFGKTMNSGNTHVDPPALTIALLTTIVLLFFK
ncbi:hypothetical protein [Sporomusa acidovorans]|uniref:DUF7973 domain-containing protein n=1 Tax=Sporomusa acidovorans (strain ATCC 49682 / DSM 3132 / Mol) TaxID=1123286 RepID=A0ABZ3J9R7_SPOA4|nr:hypothetical protein [Sporomusa acidovorans]OZC17330.1 hypothetical protein SPACI_38000 [Sporomusa acidovorans DSM 3132]SDF45293.1 hypothetical protein SAMN04488499_10506 [Sporomusa acidovorans]